MVLRSIKYLGNNNDWTHTQFSGHCLKKLKNIQTARGQHKNNLTWTQ